MPNFPHTYSKQDIKQWQEDLDELPKKIIEKESQIEKVKLVLKEWEEKLNTLMKERLNPIQNKIKGLNAQINVLTLPEQITELKKIINVKEEKLKIGKYNVEGITKALEEIDARIKIINVQLAEKEKLESELSQLLTQKEQAKSSLEKHRQEMSRLSVLSANAQNDLIRMRAELNMCEQLQIQYNQTYPSNNAVVVNNQHQATNVVVNNAVQTTNGYSAKTQDQGGYSAKTQQPTPFEGHGVGVSNNTVNNLVTGIEFVNASGEFQNANTVGQITATVLPTNTGNMIPDFVQQNLERINSLKNQIVSKGDEEVALLNAMHTEQRNIEMLEEQTRTLTPQIAKVKLSLVSYGNVYRNRDNEISIKNNYEVKKSEQATIVENLTINLKNLKKEKTHKDKLLAQSKVDCIENKDNTDLEDLNSKLKVERATEKGILNEKAVLDNKIWGNESDINKLSIQQQNMEKSLQAARNNEYLKTLTRDPAALVQPLYETSKYFFEEYDKKFPSHQPSNVRLCLADAKFIPSKIFDSNKSAEDKYYSLCGFIYTHYQWGQDNKFNTALINILGENCIASDEGKIAYQRFLTENNIVPTTEESLLNAEEKLFHDSLDLLRNRCHEIKTFADLQNYPKPFHKAIHQFCDENLGLAKNIEKKYKSELAKGKFDSKYYTKLLQQAHTTLNAPTIKNINDFKELGKANQDGNPSLKKKIAGSVLAITGVATVVLSLIADVISLGFASPISYLTIGTGITMFGTGISLFANGRKKNIAKNISNNEKLAWQTHTLFVKQLTQQTQKTVPEKQKDKPQSIPDAKESDIENLISLLPQPSAPAL